MDPAKDEEALYEQLYNELISGGNNKRDRDASAGYVDAQDFKVRGYICRSGCPARAFHPIEIGSARCSSKLYCRRLQRLKAELTSKTQECAALQDKVSELQLVSISLPRPAQLLRPGANMRMHFCGVEVRSALGLALATVLM